MARPQGDPSDLIRRLDAALKVVRPSDVVNAPEMAQIIGMSWRNLLLAHIEPDSAFPIQRRGSEGVPFEFRVAKVLRHMRKRAVGKIKASNDKARRTHRLTSFEVPEAAGFDIGINEVNKLIDANVKGQRAKVEQNLYCLRSAVDAFVVDYNSMTQAGILGAGQKADPIGDMPADARVRLEEWLRNLCVKQQAMAEDWIAGRYETAFAKRTPGGRRNTRR